MSTAPTSSSSDHDHQTSEPPTKSTVSPSWPFKQIVDKYYALAAKDREVFNALIQPRNTTKASLLFHALTERAVTSKDYYDHTFTIPVEFHYSYCPPNNDHFDTIARLPIVMCTNEGITKEFKKELERVFGDSVLKTTKFEKLEIKSLDVGFSDANYRYGFDASHTFGENTHVLLDFLKTRGGVDNIIARCNIEYPEDS